MTTIFRNTTKLALIGISASLVCISLSAVPATASDYIYVNGKETFKQAVRDHGQKVGQGARNYGRDAAKGVKKVMRYAPGLKPTRSSKGWKVKPSPWGYLLKPNCVGENC